jgi:hypothetical protein
MEAPLSLYLLPKKTVASCIHAVIPDESRGAGLDCRDELRHSAKGEKSFMVDA